MDAMTTRHTGGRLRRELTGILRCSLCGSLLEADSRTRHPRRFDTNGQRRGIERQARYTCPRRHLAILALPTEALVGHAIARRVIAHLPTRLVLAIARRRRASLSLAMKRTVINHVDVLPGRPGATTFDPSRLRAVWADGEVTQGAS